MLELATTGGRSSLTVSEVIGIRNAYMSNASVNYIAKLYHKDRLVIYNCVLFHTYASIPNRTPNRHRGTRTLTSRQIAMAHDTYERGGNKEYVAAMFGVGTKYIEKYLQGSL